jgi:hypothetical protein
MSQLVEFPLDGGGSIWIEAEESPVAGPVVRGAPPIGQSLAASFAHAPDLPTTGRQPWCGRALSFSIGVARAEPIRRRAVADERHGYLGEAG